MSWSDSSSDYDGGHFVDYGGGCYSVDGVDYFDDVSDDRYDDRNDGTPNRSYSSDDNDGQFTFDIPTMSLDVVDNNNIAYTDTSSDDEGGHEEATDRPARYEPPQSYAYGGQSNSDRPTAYLGGITTTANTIHSDSETNDYYYGGSPSGSSYSGQSRRYRDTSSVASDAASSNAGRTARGPSGSSSARPTIEDLLIAYRDNPQNLTADQVDELFPPDRRVRDNMWNGLCPLVDLPQGSVADEMERRRDPNWIWMS